MKLAAILETNDVFTFKQDGEVVLVEARKFVRNSDGFAVAIQGGMAAKALAQYMKYRRRLIAKFQASTQNEKKLYRSIVKDLMATDQYVMLKNRMVGGVHVWELQRKDKP